MELAEQSPTSSAADVNKLGCAIHSIPKSPQEQLPCSPHDAFDATKTKPFNIDKKLVYDAYKAVKVNAGAAGVDGQSLEQFAQDLGRNLYKIWNRMSSGSYFPPPVRAVPIPKKNGGQRILGVPTRRA
jgi:retron-type reverse transcriptase